MREVCVYGYMDSRGTRRQDIIWVAKFHISYLQRLWGGEKRKTCLFLSDGRCGWYSNSTGVLSLLRHQDKKVIGKLLAAAAGVVGNQNLGHGNAFCTKFCYWFGDGF